MPFDIEGDTNSCTVEVSQDILMDGEREEQSPAKALKQFTSMA